MERCASGFVAELAGQGYTPPSATLQLRLIAHLSDWLAAEDSCHQDHGPGVTPLHGTNRISAAHVRGVAPFEVRRFAWDRAAIANSCNVRQPLAAPVMQR